MEIVNMNELTQGQINQAAQILTDSLREGWANLDEAMGEIRRRLIPENTLLAAVDTNDVIGWGGILKPKYHGNCVELHPLAVEESRRGKGIGRAIVAALESEARRMGVKTIWLGADDERDGGETSLAHVDLFDNLPEKLQEFDPGTHQSAFYMKLGYKIIGVMPDANGSGKPDIFLAKKL